MAKDKDPGEGLSDEEWAEFEKQFSKESTKTAPYKEPSARQRELTAKWKAEPPKDTGWRTDGPQAVLSSRSEAGSGTGSGAGSAAYEWERPRRRWVKKLAWVVLAVIAVSLVLELPSLVGHRSSTAETPFGGALPGSDPSGIQASTSVSQTSGNPDDRFFDGSPSIDWANGYDGLVTPQAAQVGDYSATTVGAAYTALRTMLIDMDINPKVLTGGEPTAMFALTDPREGVQALYEKSVAQPTADHDPKQFATRFDPKRVQVLGKTVKVHGGMSAAVATSGDLIVTADYEFVYAVGLTDASGATDRSLVHRAWQLDIPASPRAAGKAGTYWVSWWDYDISNDACGVHDGWINPEFGASDPHVSGPPVDPYATTPLPVNPTTAPSSASTPAAATCQSVTRI